MTSDHFRHGEKHLDETVFALRRVTADANPGEHGQAESDCGAVHDRSIAFDRTGFFQQFDPSRTGRRRETHPLGQHIVWQSSVGLKLAKNLQVYCVKIPGIGRIGHESSD